MTIVAAATWCAALGFAGVALGAEATASIKGTVTDQSGKPIPGATVYLADLRQFQVRPVQTDAAGRYTSPGLPPARYFVVATAPGYHRYDKFGLPLAEGEHATHDVVLERAIPDGFHSIFNGSDLSGWHISKTVVHGSDPDIRVISGVIAGTQNPFLKGGLLLTDKKYRNVEVSLDIWPDLGCDGGLFLRSSEAGQAYQVTIDYLRGGTVGGIYGEGLRGVQGPRERVEWERVWKPQDWNNLRARITGDVPRIEVWINGTQVLDWTDTANHAVNGAVEGHIGLQVHMLERWKTGGFHRFRNIAVKELP